MQVEAAGRCGAAPCRNMCELVRLSDPTTPVTACITTCLKWHNKKKYRIDAFTDLIVRVETLLDMPHRSSCLLNNARAAQQLCPALLSCVHSARVRGRAPCEHLRLLIGRRAGPMTERVQWDADVPPTGVCLTRGCQALVSAPPLGWSL